MRNGKGKGGEKREKRKKGGVEGGVGVGELKSLIVKLDGLQNSFGSSSSSLPSPSSPPLSPSRSPSPSPSSSSSPSSGRDSRLSSSSQLDDILYEIRSQKEEFLSLKQKVDQVFKNFSLSFSPSLSLSIFTLPYPFYFFFLTIPSLDHRLHHLSPNPYSPFPLFFPPPRERTTR